MNENYCENFLNAIMSRRNNNRNNWHDNNKKKVNNNDKTEGEARALGAIPRRPNSRRVEDNCSRNESVRHVEPPLHGQINEYARENLRIPAHSRESREFNRRINDRSYRDPQELYYNERENINGRAPTNFQQQGQPALTNGVHVSQQSPNRYPQLQHRTNTIHNNTHQLHYNAQGNTRYSLPMWNFHHHVQRPLHTAIYQPRQFIQNAQYSPETWSNYNFENDRTRPLLPMAVPAQLNTAYDDVQQQQQQHGHVVANPPPNNELTTWNYNLGDVEPARIMPSNQTQVTFYDHRTQQHRQMLVCHPINTDSLPAHNNTQPLLNENYGQTYKNWFLETTDTDTNAITNYGLVYNFFLAASRTSTQNSELQDGGPTALDLRINQEDADTERVLRREFSRMTTNEDNNRQLQSRDKQLQDRSRGAIPKQNNKKFNEEDNDDAAKQEGRLLMPRRRNNKKYRRNKIFPKVDNEQCSALIVTEEEKLNDEDIANNSDRSNSASHLSSDVDLDRERPSEIIGPLEINLSDEQVGPRRWRVERIRETEESKREKRKRRNQKRR